MSHHWHLRCPRCKESTGSINKGAETWEGIIQAWPRIRVALFALESVPPMLIDYHLDICGLDCGCSTSDVWSFIRQHYDHGLVAVDEYGVQHERD